MFGLLLYFNSLNNKFMMDDYVFLKNPVYSGTKYVLSQWNPYREEVRGVLRGQLGGFYRPMTHIVYDLCYSTFKDDVWKYHLLNLFLFAFAASLIYLLIVKLTQNESLAFLSGFFYLIHPVNGIIVNYISASVFAFQVICTLSAILLLLQSLERANNRVFYFLSLLFSFLSLFWNESGVMGPFYICAVVLIFRGDPIKRKACYLFPYFLIVFSYLVIRFLYFNINDFNFKNLADYHMSFGQYAGGVFQVFAWYIGKLFYPQDIVMQWATPILHDHIFWYLLGGCLLIISFIFLFIRITGEKVCKLALILFLIGFVPGFLAVFRTPENGAQIEPHWFIFSSIGFFILASYFCLLLLDRMKVFGIVVLFMLVFAWGSVSHANNLLWADQRTYALYWSQQAPGIKLTYFYLADAYKMEGSSRESK